MKKLALFLLGLGSLATVSLSAFAYSPTQSEPQYQEQNYDQVPCAPDTCTQLPCVPDTVCNPAPCNPAPCNPGC